MSDLIEQDRIAREEAVTAYMAGRDARLDVKDLVEEALRDA